MANTSPEVGMFQERSVNEAIVKMYGSFQGNAGASPVTTQVRGYFFTATWVSTGLYKVALANPPQIAAQGTASNNTGLFIEPKAWITSESETAATLPVKKAVVECSRVTTDSAFWIRVWDIVGAALYDVTSADRINFELGWKFSDINP